MERGRSPRSEIGSARFSIGHDGFERARLHGEPAALPHLCDQKILRYARSRITSGKTKSQPHHSLVESHAFIQRQNEILLTQCRTRWRGMWMLPAITRKRNALVYTARCSFTHHQIALQLFRAKPRSPKPDERWFPISQLQKIPIPLPHRRALFSVIPSAQSKDPVALPLS
jgi:hypothetical protein